MLNKCICIEIWNVVNIIWSTPCSGAFCNLKVNVSLGCWSDSPSSWTYLRHNLTPQPNHSRVEEHSWPMLLSRQTWPSCLERFSSKYLLKCTVCRFGLQKSRDERRKHSDRWIKLFQRFPWGNILCHRKKPKTINVVHGVGYTNNYPNNVPPTC